MQKRKKTTLFKTEIIIYKVGTERSSNTFTGYFNTFQINAKEGSVYI